MTDHAPGDDPEATPTLDHFLTTTFGYLRTGFGRAPPRPADPADLTDPRLSRAFHLEGAVLDTSRRPAGHRDAGLIQEREQIPLYLPSCITSEVSPTGGRCTS